MDKLKALAGKPIVGKVTVGMVVLAGVAYLAYRRYR